jgi:hypothetical protein
MKVGFRKTGDVTVWMELAEGWVRWQDLVSAVLNLAVGHRVTSYGWLVAYLQVIVTWRTNPGENILYTESGDSISNSCVSYQNRISNSCKRQTFVSNKQRCSHVVQEEGCIK